MTVSVGLRRRLAGWFQGSVNRRILAAALTVGGFSVLVKLTATAKELAVAYRFGTGDAVDAYLIAFLIPQLVVNVVAGSLTPAFTPVYIEVRESEGGQAARRLFGSTTVASGGVLLGIMCALVAFMPLSLHWIAGGFSAEKLALTRRLFLLLAPVVVLNGAIVMWSAVLNAEKHFASVALAPICLPLVTLVLVVGLGRTWGIYSLTLGTVLGFAAQCAFLALCLLGRGLPVVPRWSGVTPAVRRIGAQYLPMVAGAALTSGSWTIGQAMAATLPAGSVASLNYGNKVVAMLSEIGSMALATAVLPHFSEMVARRQWRDIRRTIRVYTRLITLGAVPLTTVFILLSGWIVRTLFQRGAFTPEDAHHVAIIQSLFLLQIPFVMVGMLFVRLASSLQRNQILLVGAAITLPLNVALNFFLMRSLGAAGVALSTSIVYLVSCCYLALAGQRALREVEQRNPRVG